MTVHHKITTSLFLSLFLLLNLQGQAIPVFEESDGLVVIEAESAAAYFSWVSENSITGFTGDRYLHYRGPDFFNQCFDLTFRV